MEQLLKILENNARLPVEDIATMLNKSPAEVAAMMDLARAQGIIKGYKTLVDWEKAGVNRVEAVIELNVSPKKSRGFDEIAATIAAFDEVESVLLMSGGYDLQLVIKGQTFQEIALFVAKRLSPIAARTFSDPNPRAIPSIRRISAVAESASPAAPSMVRKCHEPLLPPLQRHRVPVWERVSVMWVTQRRRDAETLLGAPQAAVHRNARPFCRA